MKKSFIIFGLLTLLTITMASAETLDSNESTTTIDTVQNTTQNAQERVSRNYKKDIGEYQKINDKNLNKHNIQNKQTNFKANNTNQRYNKLPDRNIKATNTHEFGGNDFYRKPLNNPHAAFDGNRYKGNPHFKNTGFSNDRFSHHDYRRNNFRGSMHKQNITHRAYAGNHGRIR